MAKKSRDLDVKSAVTQIVPKQVKSVDNYVINYDAQGDKIEKPDEESLKTCASVVKLGKRFAYRIKMNREGKLYDPKQNGPTYSLTMKDRLTGADAFVLREVSPTAFEVYVKYLQKRFDSLLLSAQREI